MPADCFSAAELGASFRANRLALRKTLQWVATRVGCRRQTIADLEAGKGKSGGSRAQNVSSTRVRLA
jgi:hypothetical protein